MRPLPKTILPEGDPHRTLRLVGELTPDSSGALTDGLLRFDAESQQPIVLCLTTPGGCVHSGLALIDVMGHIRSPVFTIAMGMVASMGAIILAVGQPGYRYAFTHTRILVHEVSGAVSGHPEKVASSARLQQESARRIEQILRRHTRLTKSQLRQLLPREQFLTSNEAKYMGLIDHIL